MSKIYCRDCGDCGSDKGHSFTACKNVAGLRAIIESQDAEIDTLMTQAARSDENEAAATGV